MRHQLGHGIAIVAAAAWLSAPAGAQPQQPSQGQGHQHQGHHPGPGAGAMAQMRSIHELFVNHDRITRSVTNLRDGVRTVTESDDPRIAKLIADHVAGSRKQVESGTDPGLPMESAALRAIYANYDKIVTTVEATEKGVVVVQTAADAQVVAALQQHAAEVTEFVTEGMAAMHKAMMKKRLNGAGGVQPPRR